MALKKTYYAGRFGFRQNCTVPHLILEGETVDGYPVIVFPKDTTKVVIDRDYHFMAVTSRDATYTIAEGLRKTTYRVIHAADLKAVNVGEGDFVDAILHNKSGEVSSTLASTLSSKTLAGLQALKARL